MTLACPAEVPEGLPKIPGIHQAVYTAASHPGALDMSSWHTCETTHCRAGWVVALAGDVQPALQHEYRLLRAGLHGCWRPVVHETQ